MAEFCIKSDYKLMGDQPQAVEKLVKGIKEGKKHQTLMGVTGSGKTFTMANIIEQVQKPQDRAYLAIQALHPLRLEEVLGLKGADVEGSIIHIRRAVTHPDRNKPIVKETKTDGSVRDLDLVEQIKKYIPDTAPDDSRYRRSH